MTLLLNMLFAGTGALGFTILYNAKPETYVCAWLTGAIGWMFYYIPAQYIDAGAASFLSAAAVAFLSRTFAARKKCPMTIFLIAGIFPIVPGAGVYYTMYYLVTDQLRAAAMKGITSMKVAFAIVLGIVVILSIPKKWFFVSNWRRKDVEKEYIAPSRK